jgi:hypothetical protein
MRLSWSLGFHVDEASLEPVTAILKFDLEEAVSDKTLG